MRQYLNELLVIPEAEHARLRAQFRLTDEQRKYLFAELGTFVMQRTMRRFGDEPYLRLAQQEAYEQGSMDRLVDLISLSDANYSEEQS